MRILIVEDEVNAREGLGDLLGKLNENYIVCGKASDGERGLALAKEIKPDLIFTDIEMPKLNGLDMVEKIKEHGIYPYIIILSGYSDFQYAQKAIRLGIEEYLLKPITYSDLKSSMESIEKKFELKKEKDKLLRKELPKEEILGEILLNGGRNSEKLYKVIESNIKLNEKMYLVNLYLGKGYESKTEVIKKQINDFMKCYKINNFYYSIIKGEKYLPTLINTKVAFLEFIRMLKYNLLFSLRKDGFTDITISVVELKELSEIVNSMDKLRSLSKWHIVLGNDEVLYEELISRLKVNHCNYPREIENELLTAIKKNNYVKLMDINKKFILYLKTNIYNPLEIIDACSKYIFSILTFSKGCNRDLYTEFKNEGILEQIRGSCTLDELKEQLDILIDKVCKKNDTDCSINSLSVRKTINYIKEYYNDRISLEEIASGINITPEYLSRLFSKEIGKCFSDYLKEYRIDKAKKMMTNEKLKIYEIAEKVGYSDSKYFCKVFKELTGMSPKEYMKFY